MTCSRVRRCRGPGDDAMSCSRQIRGYADEGLGGEAMDAKRPRRIGAVLPRVVSGGDAVGRLFLEFCFSLEPVFHLVAVLPSSGLVEFVGA